MSRSTHFVMSPEAEVLTFKQRGGENLKISWEIISFAHKKIQHVLALNISIWCFYLGRFGRCKHALDLVVGGNFLECEETKAINAINGLVGFFLDDNVMSDINDKLEKIVKKLDILRLK